jgi:serine/threonine protein kinase/formylglycine-generating enzyme required for sulfatase activity
MTGKDAAAGDGNSENRMEQFRNAVWKDVDDGRLQPFDAYLAQFPGDEDAMRREFSAIVATLRSALESADRHRATAPADGQAAEIPRLADPDLGRHLGPWRLLREIGRGGQGAVYLAEDARLRRKAAVKILTAAGYSDSALDRFKREAAVASRLDHPGICAVYDVALEGGMPYIAMRYVEGETFAQRIASSRSAADSRPADPGAPSTQVELSRILRLIEQTARTVHAAHEAGVIHRDLKPGNIMVTAEGEPVVLDFGLAKDLSGAEATLTHQGDVMGTPAYMSPEQIEGHGIALDRRTDVYSLGVTLFECLTFKRPFDAPTREGLFKAIISQPTPDPRSLNRTIPKDLKVVLETALDKERERRYATALDFAEDLRRVRCSEPITAHPASAVTKLSRWARRSPALASALFGLVAALAAGLTVAVVLLDRATTERNDKENALADFERLAVVSRLQSLEGEREAVWPLTERNHLRRKEWLQRAERLAAELPQHEATLERLRKDATVVEDAAKPPGDTDNATPNGGDDLARGALGPPPAAEPSSDSVPTTRPGQRTWRLADPAAQFKHDVLAAFVDDLRQFATSNRFHRKLVGMRRQDSESDRFLALLHGEHKQFWDTAITSIRDVAACPRYKGQLILQPQFGLVPIGRNPHSGLWEFMDLGTCAEGQDPRSPLRDDGTLKFEAGHGVVFVLLPGGDALIGSRVATETGTAAIGRGEAIHVDIDRDAEDIEHPPRVVPFAPLLVSKYELTQRQWERLTGVNPSYYNLDGSCRPVEQVSWQACVRWARFAAMRLPTGSEWEYACRAGTQTPWWTGSTMETLRGAARIREESVEQPGPRGTAEVGTLRPNAFGLHDTHGNVWEWCLDKRASSEEATSTTDSGRADEFSIAATRTYRGGSIHVVAKFSRSAFSDARTPTNQTDDLGFRPCRNITAP